MFIFSRRIRLCIHYYNLIVHTPRFHCNKSYLRVLSKIKLILQVLLAQLTQQRDYQNSAKNFCDFSVRLQKRTPKGLIYIDKFGTLCHAANIAFICLQAADSHGIGDPQEYRDFAKQQISYMLGGGGKYLLSYTKKVV